MKNKKLTYGIAISLILALILATVALAENVKNDVVVGGNDTINAGGSTTIYFWIQDTGQPNTCEASDGTPVTISINVPTGVTRNPTSLTFSLCNTSGNEGNPNNTQGVTFSSSTPGDYSITVTATDSADPTAYNVNNAAFTLHVLTAPPSDSTPPVITPNVSGTPGNNGWYVSDVTVSWTVSDPDSTVTSTTGCGTTTINTDTTGTTLTCSATSAGGTSSESVTIKRDATSPSLSNCDAPDGLWLPSDVTLYCYYTDATSGPATQDVSLTTNVAAGTETANAVASANGTQACDNAANCAASPADISLNKVDKKAPVVTVTPGRFPDFGAWYNHAVVFDTAGTDGGSGILDTNCTANQTYSSHEGTGTTVSGSCTDNVGNVGNGTSAAFNYDGTAPTNVLLTATGTAGANGWFTDDVTVTTSGDDVVSGVTCTDPQAQTTETTGATFNGSCTNGAGLTTDAAPLTVKLDKTGPTAQLSAVGTLGNSGWYVSDVTITTTGSDSISNPTTCSANQTQTTDTSGATFNGSCTNNAGLSTNAVALTIKRDATNPTLTWNGGPADGSSHYFGSVSAAPTCTAADELSGPNGCTVTGYATTVGSHTMTATAYDVAGNSYRENRSYTVLAWTLNGFFQPVDMGSVVNIVKGGSTVPLKFEVFAGPLGTNEQTSTSVVAFFKATPYTCNGSLPTDEIEITTTGGTSLRYDAIAGQFIQNWQTPKGQIGTCWVVTMTTQDGSFLKAFFKLK